MVHTDMLKCLAQMCTRDRKKGALLFQCSLWVYVSHLCVSKMLKNANPYFVSLLLCFAIPASAYNLEIYITRQPKEFL